LKNFIDATKSLSPDEKGQKLEADEKIGDIHEACAQEGQTEVRKTFNKEFSYFSS